VRSKSRFVRGELLVVSTFDGRNAIVWSMSTGSKSEGVDIDVIDSLEDGDICLCITPSPYFEEYVIVLTHNGVLGYVQETCVKKVSELCDA